MIEHIQLGSVTCDYVSWPDLTWLAEQWLAEPRLHHLVTLNPEMVMQAERDAAFRAALAGADLRVPDGAGLIWAQWYIRSQFWSLLPSLLAFPFRNVLRITGVDTVHVLAKLCVQHRQPMYLLGGTTSQVEQTAASLRRQFPGLNVSTSPDHTFDPVGPASILDDLKEKQPAVLLVAYGAPKQTVWIARHKDTLPSVRIAVGVGGAFAILSEERPRAPRFLQQLNLEWLWRLLLEPSRLPRIWHATVQFPLLIKRQKSQQPAAFAS